MLRFVVFSLVSLAIVMSCMGQMFQYSRGWTNGKRSSAHLLQEDPTMAEIVFEVPSESERRLERCIIQLQRFIQNPYFIRPSYAATAGGNLFSNGNVGGITSSNRHQSNEIFEDLAASGSSSSSADGLFSTKQN
ncbi:pro-corazonin-like [Eupeodes corollae]|uniref:pro-corazonin-like n=1 Tax=Eupeodes corollae TaxID=290404 RepID=UPI0024939AE5|nr:pro-corazonin-like [Eupeodes corollae]